MKNFRLKLFFIIIFSLSCFIKGMILNDDKRIIFRKLDDDDDDGEDMDCEGTAYEPTDCYQIEIDSGDDEHKCCFLEYKDKGIDNKRKRICHKLTYDQFLDIKKTIKTIKESNKNYTVFSLECDKSKFLSLKRFLLLILLLINL